MSTADPETDHINCEVAETTDRVFEENAKLSAQTLPTFDRLTGT